MINLPFIHFTSRVIKTFILRGYLPCQFRIENKYLYSIPGDQTMKILVFGGSGKIGAAVAWDLVKREDVISVGLVGRNEKRLRASSA